MDSEAMTVVVELPIAEPSIVSVNAIPPSPDTQTAVQFSATVRGDQRETTRYSWDFGDGASSSAERPTHTFTTEGTYTVQLNVSNSAGSATRPLTLTVLPYEAAICRELTDLNGAFFDRNSSTLKDEARAALQENVAILNECPNVCVKIEAFAVGNERRPQQLSQARASAIEQFYLDNGVAASRMVVEGKGLVAGISAKDGYSQFRRGDTIPGVCHN